MVFLLFLASVAVLEYLVRETGQKSATRSKVDVATLGNAMGVGPVQAETTTSDLLALGKALGTQKGVTATDSERVGSRTSGG